MEKSGLGVKDIIQYSESSKIKDGAYGTNHSNKLADVINVPWARLLEIIGVDFISWNCSLGNIIKKIIEQDLNGSHR